MEEMVVEAVEEAVVVEEVAAEEVAGVEGTEKSLHLLKYR